MPPRKQASKKSPQRQGQSSISAPASSTSQKFEAELHDLASQARIGSRSKRTLSQLTLYGKAASLLALVAVYAHVSLLTLSPVYGSIPSAAWHPYVIWTACFTGWAGNLTLRRILPVRTRTLLPLVAAYIPMMQFYLFKMSGTLGAKWGPVVTEALTLFPLVVLSVACVADELESADLSGLPKWAADAAPGLGSYGFYKFVETFSAEQLRGQIGRSFLVTRVALELVLAGTYAVVAPSKLLIICVPAFLHAAYLNTHVMTPMATQALNTTLTAQGWSLVDRRESVTGYVSVLDSHQNGFRVMRCDHSLLGGEWTSLPKVVVGEPVYSVFTMLEAVRLVESASKVPDKEARALNIGLGIGTTPAALIAHGIDTTIVEIDPVVHSFAVKYFGLPSRHNAIIEDAVSYTARMADGEADRFDYIIHDVFTGGAEPIPLFTLEFLRSLHTLLNQDGVIAINYAGDFLLPPLSTVVRTIREVFASCRIFRESPAPSEDQLKEEGQDFENVVIFCRKTDDKITFREPVAGDFLQSRSRHQALMPQHEVFDVSLLTTKDIGIVRQNDTSQLAKWQDDTARGHWTIMRKVLPALVWENW